MPTIRETLSQHPPNNIALRDAEGETLTYAELLAFVDGPGRLNVDAQDTVMYMLEEGALSAVAFLAVASCAKAAPIGLSTPRQELLSAMQDLQPRILLMTAHAASIQPPFGDVCKELGIDLVLITPTGKGLF